MMSLETVKDLAREAAREAEERGSEPLSIRGFDPEQPRDFIRRIPFLGDYTPEGWEAADGIDDLFVDSSGFGAPGEAALTVDQFEKKLDAFRKSRDNFGFGISAAGQFQVYIRVYRPASKDFTRSGHLTSNDLKLVY